MDKLTIPKRYEPEHNEFEFYYLPKNNINHKEVKKYSDWVSKNFASICGGSMTSDLNSEWILRTYNSTKMVMASTLLLNSAKYCIEKNILVSVPYLLYYSAFSACRSLIYVAPIASTKTLDGLLKITHSKVLQIAPDVVSRINLPLANELKEKLNDMQYERELFSYVFPASGINKNVDFESVVNLCGVFVELAELTGRRVQHYIEKNYLQDEARKAHASKTWQVLNKDIVSNLFEHKKKIGNGEQIITWIDKEDWYRVDYIKRKVKYPCSILFTMTEGMTEDFFGSWCKENIIEEDFNPDSDWNIIFPIP